MAVDTNTSILLVRHGATEETDAQRYPSIRDLPLSERGRNQAQPFAGTLQAVELDAVFTSPSQRARETAVPLASQRDLELHIIPELAEMGFGQLGGMSFAEAVQTFPEALKRWIENPFEVTLPRASRFWTLLGVCGVCGGTNARVVWPHDRGGDAWWGHRRLALPGRGATVERFLAGYSGAWHWRLVDSR